MDQKTVWSSITLDAVKYSQYNNFHYHAPSTGEIDQAHKIQDFYSNNIDIMTEEERYWKERDFFITLLDQIPCYIFWKNKYSVFLGCNKRFAKIAGLNSPQEIVGKTDYDLPWKKHESDLYIADDMQVIESKAPKLNIEEPQTCPDGTHITLLTSKVPLIDKNGEAVGILGIYNDITERKKAEKELFETKERKAQAEAELQQAVMVLSGSIAHDLRTPIAIMEMKGDTLKKYMPILIESYYQAKAANLPLKDDLPSFEPQRKRVLKSLEEMGRGSIVQLAREMHDFIDITLKTLSQVLKGKLNQEGFVCCAIWHSVHNALTRYPFSEDKRDLVHNNIRYNFDFLGNALLILRLLTNLLKNSLEQIIKNKRGEIFITTEDGGDMNILRFKDTAGGAPPEIVAKIFEGYCTTKEEGTGIGLAFCKITMGAFGGDITCSSFDNDSIEFVLHFPKLIAQVNNRIVLKTDSS